MALTNLISDIQPTFNRILEYTQGYEIISDDVFQKWADRKEGLYKLFGNQLIKNLGYMEFHLSDKEKELRINQFITVAHLHIDKVDEAYQFEQFIRNNKDSFFDNIVSCAEPCPSKADLKVGMKMVRAFKFFITDKKALTHLQEVASAHIQQNKISGEFCVSIHPLDFLTASVNTYKWRSCHALDGEYRAGNLSYMADDVTFMCYLKGKDMLTSPTLPKNVSWNSKKWRMFAYLDPTQHLCFLGKQYPYALSDIEEQVLSILPSTRSWWPFSDFMMREVQNPQTGEIVPLENDYCLIASNYDCGQIIRFHKIFKDKWSGRTLHFNDVLSSSSYSPKYSSRSGLYRSRAEINNTVIKVGDSVACMHCGQLDIDPEGGNMLCTSCAYDLGFVCDDDCDYDEEDENF